MNVSHLLQRAAGGALYRAHLVLGTDRGAQNERGFVTAVQRGCSGGARDFACLAAD